MIQPSLVANTIRWLQWMKTKWVTYLFRCRELRRLATEDSWRFEAMLAYYSRFELLSIDEFSNSETEGNG